MPKFYVTIGQLVRQQKTVIVECKSKEELQDRLSEVYEQDNGSGEWEDDIEWGAEESDARTIDGPANDKDDPDIILKD